MNIFKPLASILLLFGTVKSTINDRGIDDSCFETLLKDTLKEAKSTSTLSNAPWEYIGTLSKAKDFLFDDLKILKDTFTWNKNLMSDLTMAIAEKQFSIKFNSYSKIHGVFDKAMEELHLISSNFKLHCSQLVHKADQADANIKVFARVYENDRIMIRINYLTQIVWNLRIIVIKHRTKIGHQPVEQPFFTQNFDQIAKTVDGQSFAQRYERLRHKNLNKGNVVLEVKNLIQTIEDDDLIKSAPRYGKVADMAMGMLKELVIKSNIKVGSDECQLSMILENFEKGPISLNSFESLLRKLYQNAEREQYIISEHEQKLYKETCKEQLKAQYLYYQMIKKLTSYFLSHFIQSHGPNFVAPFYDATMLHWNADIYRVGFQKVVKNFAEKALRKTDAEESRKQSELQIKSFELQVKEMKEKVSASEEKYTNLAARHEIVVQEKARAEQYLNDSAAKCKSTFSTMKAEIKKLKNDVDRLTGMEKDYELTKNELKATAESLEKFESSRDANNKDFDERMEKMKKSLVDAQEENKRLSESHNLIMAALRGDLDKERNDIILLRSEIADLKADLETLNKEKLDLKSKLMASESSNYLMESKMVKEKAPISTLNEKIKSLTANISDLEKEIVNLKAEKDELKKTEADMTKKNLQLEKIKSGFDQKIAGLINSKEDLSKNNTELKTEISDLKRGKTELEKNMTDLAAKNSVLLEKISKLKNEITAIRAGSSETQKHDEEKIQEMARNVESLEETIKELRSKATANEEEIQRLNKTIGKLENEREKIMESSAAMKSGLLEEFAQKESALAVELKKLRADFDQQIVGLIKSKEDLSNSNTDLKKEISHLKSGKTDLEKKMTDLDSENSVLLEKVSKLKSEITAIRAGSSEMQKHDEEKIQEMARNVESLEETIKELRSKATVNEEEIQRLNQAIGTLENEKAKIIESSAAMKSGLLEEFGQKESALAVELEKLKADFDQQIVGLINSKEDLSNSNTDLKKEISHLKSGKTDLEKKMTDLDSEKSILLEKVSKLKNEITAIRAGSTEMQKHDEEKIQEMARNVESLEETIKELRSKATANEEEIQRLNQAIGTLEDEKEKMVSKASATEEEIQRLNKDIGTLEDEKAKIIESSAAMKSGLLEEFGLKEAALAMELEKLKADFDQKIAGLINSKKDMSKNNTELMKEIIELKSGKTDLEKNMTDLATKNSVLHEKISKLKNEITAIRAGSTEMQKHDEEKIQEMARNVESLEETIKELRSKAAANEEEIQTLNKTIGKLENEREKIMESSAAMKSGLLEEFGKKESALVEKGKNLEKRILELQNDIIVVKDEASELQKQDQETIKRLDEKIEILETRVKGLDTEAEKNAKEIEKLTTAIEELQEEKAKLIESAERISSDLKEKELAHLALKKENEELQKGIKELRSSFEQNPVEEAIEKKIEMLEAEVESKEKEITSLSVTLSELQEEKTKLQESADLLEKRSEEAEKKLKETDRLAQRNAPRTSAASVSKRTAKESSPYYYAALGAGSVLLLLLLGLLIWKGRPKKKKTLPQLSHSPIEIVVDSKQYGRHDTDDEEDYFQKTERNSMVKVIQTDDADVTINLDNPRPWPPARRK